MRKLNLKYLVPAVFLAFIIPIAAMAAAAAPAVTTDRLQQNLNAPNQVIIDIRKIEEYKAGHIPGAVSSVWWYMLTEVLGYKNVKNYDGSIMDWAADPNAPIETSK